MNAEFLDFFPDDFVEASQRPPDQNPIPTDGSHCWWRGIHIMIMGNVVYYIIDGFRYEVMGFLENGEIVQNRL